MPEEKAAEMEEARRYFAEFRVRVKVQKSMYPDGELDRAALKAHVTIAQAEPQLALDVIPAKLIKEGINQVEVQDWVRLVKKHLSGKIMLLRRASEIIDMPDPAYLIKGLIEQGGFAMLYAKPGIGKTFVALSWSYAIAAGIPWLGHEVVAGPVVYVAAEGVGGLPKRLRALQEHHGHHAQPDDLYVITESVRLLEPYRIHEAMTAIADEGVQPQLIVVDTYARCMVGAEENSAKDTGEAVAALDDLRLDLGCAVLLIHHTGKSGSSQRGSGALTGALDTELYLDQGPGALMVVVNKQKNFDAADPTRLELKDVGDSRVPVQVAAPSGWELQGATPKREERRISLREQIEAELRRAQESGQLHLGQTALLAPIAGNNHEKIRVLHDMVDDPECAVTMEQLSNRKLYSLGSDSIPPTP